MVSQTMDLSRVALVILSTLLLAKLCTSDLTDNTFVPFDGNATSFPTPPLLGGKFWGSLLGGHYFGLRAAEPYSLIVSLMWFHNPADQKDDIQIRHWCDDWDNLDKFFWNYNDLKFGHQSIVDHNLHINTSFIKLDNQQKAIKARINMLDTSKDANLNSIILYSATESNDDTIEALNVHNFTENPVFSIKAQSKTAGNFTLNFKIVNGIAMARSYLTANSTLDKLKETVLKHMNVFNDTTSSKSTFMVGNTDKEASKHKNSFIAYQIVFKHSIEIELEMLFNDQSSLVADFNYEHELANQTAQFDLAFEEKFPLQQKNISKEMITFARAVLSNTIGGISYFNGPLLVKSELTNVTKLYGPIQLLTAVPSRSTFARGFLWDEGFHQLLISTWDPQLSMTIIQNWFALMNRDGWIPREIVLGDEAKARMGYSDEYWIPHSTTPNPPSFFLTIESLIDNKQAEAAWLWELYPRLESWFKWFNTTQAGAFPTTFRWRGRDASVNQLNPQTLSSGLDDYPRSTHPTDDEIHLDLRCWMALASRVMAKIAKTLLIENHESYKSYYQTLRDNQLLEKWHWSAEHKMFCDKGLNSDNVEFVAITKNGITTFERKVNSPPTYECIAHKGYVSLFPFAMNVLEPNNSKLEAILKDIEDPNILWTPYGLRSISKSDFYYDRFNTQWDGPYWRGTVWMNINYLVLKALNHYSNLAGPYQARMKVVYGHLRENLMNNVFKEYRRTGFVWEQYSEKNGNGKGAHPFTGWSALIVRIMSERY